MKNLLFLSLILAMGTASAVGVAWTHVDAANQLGGRKASEGYLQGKVVLVCKSSDVLPRMEQVWQSFKSKPFVLLGAGSEKAASCTFPQYAGADLASGAPTNPIYVVGETGKVLYKGADEHAATETVVTALTDLEAPRTLAQAREFLDFELANLPAHAYLRVAAFKKAYPAAAKDYEAKILELRAVKNVDKIAKLVAFAKSAKDMKDLGPKHKMQQMKQRTSIKAAIPKAKALLKTITDERLVQEAKNSLADLQWAAAAL